MAKRDNIPSYIKREVRQRCGFGCVICGNPIYDYEHMEGWANVRRHIANEITLLCPYHHREKTVGRMPAEYVKKANETPHNLKNGVSGDHKLYFYGNKARIIMGSTVFYCEDKGTGSFMIPLLIDNIPVIRFRLQDNECLLNLVILDENGVPVLVIEDNILVFKIGLWDITFEGTILIVRKRLYKVLLEIEFKTPDTVIIRKAKLFYNKKGVYITPQELRIGNNNINLTFLNSHIHAQLAISLGKNDTGITSFIGM